MAHKSSLFALLICLIAGYVAASCDVKSAQGKRYDLSAFAQNTPILIEGSNNYLDYAFCGVSKAISECTKGNSAFCIYRDQTFLYNAAVWRTDKDIKSAETTEDGLSLVFENSKHDIIGSLRMKVDIKCATTASAPVATRVAGTPYTFSLAFDHPAGCGSSGGSSGGLSGGWIFIIILLSVSFVYVVAGCLINWRVRGHALGKDACPNGAFWAALPGLVKDGASFSLAKIKGCCGGGSGGSSSSGTGSGAYEDV